MTTAAPKPKPSLARDASVRGFLARNPDWHLAGRPPALVRTFAFRSYASGLRFATAVGIMGDDADHHPSLRVDYRKVQVRWSSHDAGGVTDRDLVMAQKTDRLLHARA